MRVRTIVLIFTPNYITFLFAGCALACLLCSCGPKYRVDIERWNNSETEYSLVSVRDSSVVVLPIYERTDEYLAYTHMIVIPDTAIRRIMVPVTGDFMSSVPMMLLGAAVGATVGMPCDCEDKLSKSVIGLAVGWNIDKLRLLYESLTNDWLYLWLPNDRTKLRANAIFPTEPPIMRYVK